MAVETPLKWPDYVVIVGYFISVLAVGLVVSNTVYNNFQTVKIFIFLRRPMFKYPVYLFLTLYSPTFTFWEHHFKLIIYLYEYRFL